jgi:hypothetical protein
MVCQQKPDIGDCIYFMKLESWRAVVRVMSRMKTSLFVSLIFLFARYRIAQLNRNKLRRKNEIIEIERKRSDDLLKNILPEEVAEELKEKGEARAS